MSYFFFQLYAAHRDLHSFPTRRSSDLILPLGSIYWDDEIPDITQFVTLPEDDRSRILHLFSIRFKIWDRSEEHTSELQSRGHLVCRLLLEKKKIENIENTAHYINQFSF